MNIYSLFGFKKVDIMYEKKDQLSKYGIEIDHVGAEKEQLSGLEKDPEKEKNQK